MKEMIKDTVKIVVVMNNIMINIITMFLHTVIHNVQKNILTITRHKEVVNI